ncbi:unnamed protein product, partial [Adineta steineri]
GSKGVGFGGGSSCLGMYTREHLCNNSLCTLIRLFKARGIR